MDDSVARRYEASMTTLPQGWYGTKYAGEYQKSSEDGSNVAVVRVQPDGMVLGRVWAGRNPMVEHLSDSAEAAFAWCDEKLK